MSSHPGLSTAGQVRPWHVGLLLITVIVAGCVSVPPAAREVRRAEPAGDLAVRWYRLANRWLAYAPPSRLREPTELPDQNCAIFHGEGTGERDVRGAAYLAFIYATLGTVGPYDERLSGVPRDDLVEGSVRLLRWLGLTYPKWRRQWQSAMWAAIAAQGAWLIWDRLDDETRGLVRTMLTEEADRFLGKTPPARLDRDTKAEENAWNSLAPALAACMFGGDPRARRWDRKAREYMLSAYLRPADIESGRRVDGFALGSFKGANIRDDFSLENHGFFHPDYVACISINMMNWLPYRLADRRLPASATFNARPIVELLTQLSTPDGGVFYPSGQDWETLRRAMYAKAFAPAAVLFGDRNAAVVEGLSLRAVERLQTRFRTGAFYAPAERRFMLAEELAASSCAWLYLFHTLADPPGRDRASEVLRASELSLLEARLRGPRVLPEGRVAFNRTERTFASFTWNGRERVYVSPLRPDVEVPPRPDAFLGRVRTKGQTKVEKVTARGRATAAGRDLAVIVSIWRSDARSVRQDVAFVALGDGRVFYLERLLATRAVAITELATGVIYSPVARAGYVAETGVVLRPEGAWTPCRSEWGTGAAANVLVEPRRFRAGREISRFAIVVGEAPTEAPDPDVRSLPPAGPHRLMVRKLDLIPAPEPHIMAVRDGGTLVLANFGDEPAAIDLPAAPGMPRRVWLLPFDVFLWPPPRS